MGSSAATSCAVAVVTATVSIRSAARLMNVACWPVIVSVGGVFVMMWAAANRTKGAVRNAETAASAIQAVSATSRHARAEDADRRHPVNRYNPTHIYLT